MTRVAVCANGVERGWFMKKFIQLVVSCVVVAGSSAWADPVTINFEHPPCANLGGDVFASDCYRSLGVSFTSGATSGLSETFRIAADADAVSPPNVARPLEGFWLNAEFSRFDRGARANNLSFDVVGPQQAAWEIVFATPSFIDHIRGFGNQHVLAPRGFASGLTFFPGSSLNGIDNLTFDHSLSATPEPASLLLLGAGLLAVGRRQLRRTRRQATLEGRGNRDQAR
jgi:hypothetical protein